MKTLKKLMHTNYVLLTIISLAVAAYSFDFLSKNTKEAVPVIAESNEISKTDINLDTENLNKKLDNTRAKNELRILFHRKYQEGFGIGEQERQLIQKFADNEGYNPVWIEIENRWELLPAVYQGKGDVIVAQGYEVAGGLDGVVSFTEPWDVIKHQMITRGEQNKIKSVSGLKNREIAIKKSSGAWPYIKQLAEEEKGLKIKVIDEDVAESKILNKIRSGYYDVAVFDSEYIKNSIANIDGLNVLLDLPKSSLKVWSVSKNNKHLKQQLNDYLNKELISIHKEEPFFSDLPGLKEKGQLRLISYQSPANIYYQNGELKGLEYELLKRFAEKNNLELNVVLANSFGELFEMLEQGKGDVVSASIPSTLKLNENFSKTNAYLYSNPTIVGRKSNNDIIDISELRNRTIVLSPESPYKNFFNNLKQNSNINFNLKVVDEPVNTETLLFMVSLGVYDLTVIPSHTVKAELSRQINLYPILNISEPSKLVWVTRNEDNRLTDELNNFIKSNYRKTEFNSLKEKYIVAPNHFNGDSKLLTKIFELTPYDGVIIEHAEKYGFDWRLIAAQMYQESQFDPVAVSSAGAEGLMQIMPKTAEELGLENTKNPEHNIAAGVKYLYQLRERFEGDILLNDKNWMALAAYNAGFGRINSARKYAEKLGLDKNKWFGNVEIAMKKMAKVKLEANKKLCRCGQTVVYVRDIRTRYNNYIGLTESTQLASLAK